MEPIDEIMNICKAHSEEGCFDSEGAKANTERIVGSIFTREQLVDFGRYLLSDLRTKRIVDNYVVGDGIPLAERLKEVYHADVENFLELPQTA